MSCSVRGLKKSINFSTSSRQSIPHSYLVARKSNSYTVVVKRLKHPISIGTMKNSSIRILGQSTVKVSSSDSDR